MNTNKKPANKGKVFFCCCCCCC